MVTNRRLAGWLSSDQKLECIWSCKCWLAGPHSDHKQAGWLTDWRAGLLAGWLARSIVLWSYTGSLSGWLDCIMVTNKLAGWLAGQGAGRPIVEIYVPPQQAWPVAIVPLVVSQPSAPCQTAGSLRRTALLGPTLRAGRSREHKRGRRGCDVGWTAYPCTRTHACPPRRKSGWD